MYRSLIILAFGICMVLGEQLCAYGEQSCQLQNILQSVISAKPLREGKIIVIKDDAHSTQDDAIYVVDLSQVSAADEYWSAFLSPIHAPAYIIPERSLIVLTESFSSEARKLAEIYYGMQICLIRDQNIPWEREEEYVSVILRSRMKQQEVMLKMGGDLYYLHLQREIDRIAKNHCIEEGDLDFVPGRLDHDPVLDKIFGKSESASEKDFIQNSLYLHAVFVFFDRMYGSRSTEKKEAFLMDQLMSKVDI